MTTFSRSNQLIPAYILHSRKYKDTSLIVELMTLERGRVSAVLRGARGNKKKTGTVQPFTPLLVALVGRGDLKTVSKIEQGAGLILRGQQLLIGLYANELLVRLLGKLEELPGVFEAYQTLILCLSTDHEGDARAQIRRFELTLLTELGYGINFFSEAASGEAIHPEARYRYVADEGFHLTQGALSGQTYSGSDLIAIADNFFIDKGVERTAKHLIRISLSRILGDKPLNSREMFKQYQSLGTQGDIS